jgi:hypothetical protein
VTRAIETIGDLPTRGAVLQAACACSADGPPHSAHTHTHTHTCRRQIERSPILWQAGMLLTVTGTVGSLYNVACANSDAVVARWIRASTEVVIAPVAVAPSSA